MKKTTLITGASSGIGLELARIFAQEGSDLFLVARNETKLLQLKSELESKHNISVHVFPKDLSQPSAPEELYHLTKEYHLQVNTLVNNAGFGTYGFFKDTKLQEELNMIQVNISSLTALTKLFLPQMITQKSGKILNVASTAAFQPGPLMAVYFTTKAYVLSFSEALANELKGTGITVTTLCPGPTETEFQKRSQMNSGSLFTGNIPTAKSVAEVGYSGLMKGKTVVIPGWKNTTLTFLNRFVPRTVATAIVRRLQE